MLDRSKLPALQAAISQALPEFLRRQRWFAGKHREIESVDLADVALQDLSSSVLLAAIATVKFADGHRSTYFVPLLLTRAGDQSPEVLCTMAFGKVQWSVIDAVPEAAFHRWLLDSARQGRSVESERGRIECRLEGDAAIVTTDLSGRLAGVEQSNSSILFGDTLIAKVYRQLTPGTNPDLEVGRFLKRTGETSISPGLVASVEYLGARGPTTLVTVQEQLANPVDCWSFVLSALTRGDLGAASIGRQLGEATARMHIVFASAPATSDFAPASATERDIGLWKSAFEQSLSQTLHQLELHMGRLDATTRNLVGALRASRVPLLELAEGFDSLDELPLVRVHGDYHLGQVLRLPDGQVRIVDFEGEPQRPIHERRMKTSPLKDVAGMLRSFSYARGTAATTAGVQRARELKTWESELRLQFVEAYREAVDASGLRLLPDQISSLDKAIAAWEVDKALYEVLYELSSRPDWLWIPLEFLVDFL